VPDEVVEAYSLHSQGQSGTDKERIRCNTAALNSKKLDGYHSAKATFLIGRAEALVASRRSMGLRACRSAGLDALQAARLVPSQPRVWWTLRDAMVAGKRPRAGLTALKALCASTEDPVAIKAACADACKLCEEVSNDHPFCHDLDGEN